MRNDNRFQFFLFCINFWKIESYNRKNKVNILSWQKKIILQETGVSMWVNIYVKVNYRKKGIIYENVFFCEKGKKKIEKKPYYIFIPLYL